MSRKRTSPMEDLLDLVSLLPWWVGVALAVILYLVLHQLALTHIAAMKSPAEAGRALQHTLIGGLANAGQYILPGICIVGAAISILRRRKRQALVQAVATADDRESLNRMSWRDFEALVGEGFRLQGYSVTETGQGGADGGVDLRLRKGSDLYLVQCKQWKAFKVDVRVVREMLGLMTAEGAAGGFVITSGSFTAVAHKFAQVPNLTLIDGPQLFAMIKQARASSVHKAPSPAQPQVEAIHTPPTLGEVSCPKCGARMVRRTARQGANAGSDFWGCSAFPACRGTR